MILDRPRVDDDVVVHATERREPSERYVTLYDSGSDTIALHVIERIEHGGLVVTWNEHHVVTSEVTGDSWHDVKDHQATTASMAAVMSALS